MTSTLTKLTKKAMEFWRQRFGPIESNTRRTAEATERIDETRGRGADGIRIEGDPDGEPVPVTLADSGDNSVTSDQLPLELGPGGGLQVEGVADGIPVEVRGSVALDAGASVVVSSMPDVTITGTVTASSAAEYAEDTPHNDGDIGVQMLAVRNDANSALADDGDYHPLEVTDRGHLKVDIGSPSVVVSGAVTATPQLGIGGGSFTAPGDGAPVSLIDISAKYYSISVSATGGVLGWDVRLEVKLDGVGWSEVMAHTHTSPGANIPAFAATPRIAVQMRARCAALNLGSGTSITAIIAGSV